MKTEPTFTPKPGQLDFTNVRWCPVVNCVVRYGERVLLVRRADTMRLYPGYWNGISGFIDDAKSLEEKVYEELSEELGLTPAQVSVIELRGVFNQDAPEVGKTWIVHAVLVTVCTDQVVTDWEASTYEWCAYPVTDSRPLLPGFATVLELTCGAANRITSVTP